MKNPTVSIMALVSILFLFASGVAVTATFFFALFNSNWKAFVIAIVASTIAQVSFGIVKQVIRVSNKR